MRREKCAFRGVFTPFRPHSGLSGTAAEHARARKTVRKQPQQSRRRQTTAGRTRRGGRCGNSCGGADGGRTNGPRKAMRSAAAAQKQVLWSGETAEPRGTDGRAGSRTSIERRPMACKKRQAATPKGCGPQKILPCYSSTSGLVGSMRRKSAAATTSMAAITKSGTL